MASQDFRSSRRTSLSFRTLPSLHFSAFYSALRLRRVLEPPSKTLRHLSIAFGPRREDQVISALEFPALKVLEVHLHPKDPFPSWMALPHISNLFTMSFRFWNISSCFPLDRLPLWLGVRGLLKQLPMPTNT